MVKQIIFVLKKEFSNLAWKRSFLVWISFNLLLVGLGALFSLIIGPVQPRLFVGEWAPGTIDKGWDGAFLGVWLRWDALHYLKIAEGGYTKDFLTAFFPLYPLFGRWAGILFNTTSLIGLLIISRLSLLFSLVLFYKITKEFYNDNIALLSIIFLCLYPAGVFWLAPYPISLALLFILLTFYSAMKHRWLVVLLGGIAAGLTHGTTIPLTLTLLFYLYQRVRESRRNWLLLPAAVSPLIGTTLFLAFRITQGFPSFLTVQKTYWSRISQPPWMIWQEFYRFFNQYLHAESGWVNMILFLTVLILTIITFNKLPPHLYIYQICLLIFLASTSSAGDTPLFSYGRYLMMGFPFFIMIALQTSEKWKKVAAIGIGLASLLFLSIVFFSWRGMV